MYKKYVISIILTLIFLGPIGQFILFKYTPMYDLNLKTKLYDNATWVKGNPKIAIMGTSHARYQIIPSEIVKLNSQYKNGDIVNIGENAASPFSMYHTYMKNKDKFKNLEYIFYTLEPHVLGEKYFLYYDYEKIKLSYEQWKYLEKNNDKQNEYFFPFQTFVKSLKFEQADRSKTHGYSSLKHKDFKAYSSGNIARQLFEPLELFPISKFEIDYLKKLKMKVEKNGTKMIFVLTPTYSWHNFYKKEAKIYDNQLINLLNQEIGKSIVIGSLYPEDYNLEYEDFKDDTHLAHSGAIKFTQRVFEDINYLKNLEDKKFYNTFTYREKNENLINFHKEEVDLELLPWKGINNYKINFENNKLVYSESEFKKFSTLYTTIIIKEIFHSIKLDLELPKEKLTMISITVNNKSGYAHFFIKPEKFNNGKIDLDKFKMAKWSDNFEFGSISKLTIRCYPEKNNSITNFKVNSLSFLIK